MSHLSWIAVLTALIEGVTCLFRFGIGMQSTRDTAFLAQFTFGFRIHHGYLGVILLLVLLAWPAGHPVRIWGVRIGWALVASDLIHHFAVLWPLTGDPQFHLRYPPR